MEYGRPVSLRVLDKVYAGSPIGCIGGVEWYHSHIAQVGNHVAKLVRRSLSASVSNSIIVCTDAVVAITPRTYRDQFIALPSKHQHS